jgi:hypothetical protein
MGKSSYLNLLDIGFTLFTPMKGRIDSLTVYIYKAETCTNIPQNVCQCLCFITIPRRSFHRTCGASQK